MFVTAITQHGAKTELNSISKKKNLNFLCYSSVTRTYKNQI